MVGIVLVSHSRALAQAALEMVHAMTGDDTPIAVAAGSGEGHTELGTDATEIYSAIEDVYGPEGVLVLMDIGSAILSAETALDLLDEQVRANTRLCPCPFVEGAVAAGVAAKIGSTLDEVYNEAVNALAQKQQGITREENPAPTAPAPDAAAEKAVLTLPIPAGLHARPVVNLIKEASKYKSAITIRNVTTGRGPVSLRSMTSVISLEILYGHQVELSASGPDAAAALAGLKAAIESGLGDPLAPPGKAATQAPAASPPDTGPAGTFKPVGVSKGFAIGPVFYPGTGAVEIPPEKTADPAGEIATLRSAIGQAEADMSARSARLSAAGDTVQSGLVAAHAGLVSDPELAAAAEKLINTDQVTARYAWNTVLEEARRKFLSLADENLRLRAMDLKDVAAAVLEKLGVETAGTMSPPAPSVLVVDELTPDQAAGLDKELVLGVICIHNGPTSHSSILLASRGIPAVVQAANSGLTLTGLAPSTVIAMDGQSGEIWVAPDEKTTAEFEARKAEFDRQRAENLAAGKSPALTRDNVTVRVYANIGRPGDAALALDNGADGIGLFRTEFMFLDRTSAPTEQQQLDAMREILLPVRDRDIVVRTLDAGGDKELPYLGMPHEVNPQLGIRAIRLSLLRPDMFLTQLRAILRLAGEMPGIRIMFPFISMPGQLAQAKGYLQKAHEQLESENIAHRWPVPTGMMMEVPSAALTARDYMPLVDFVSIGTNDLTQYTLAAERDNAYIRPFIPTGPDRAVLLLAGNICAAAKQHGVEVSVCGEMAADPASAASLLGLGVNVLSMSAQNIPGIKTWIRRQNMEELRKSIPQELNKEG